MTVMIAQMMSLDPASVDRLLPMHLLLLPSGHVGHVGPTLKKVVPTCLRGRRFLDLFDVRRPRAPATVAELASAPMGRISLVLRDAPRTTLKGQAVLLPDGCLFLDLSFGIGVVEAVTQHALTAADFAPTDLTIEMLYLVEAKAAVKAESRKLNERLKQAKREAEAQALSDTLTGLGNRRAMDEALTRMLARGEAFGLMHLDLDYFKDVNDTLGHAAGDHVLATVAEVLRDVTRVEDVVARVGGDEFVILIRGMTDPLRLTELGQRLVARLEQPIRWQRRVCRISGSVGITSTAHYRRPDADRMLSDADEALYASKRGGRAMVSVARPDPEGGGGAACDAG